MSSWVFILLSLISLTILTAAGKASAISPMIVLKLNGLFTKLDKNNNLILEIEDLYILGDIYFTAAKLPAVEQKKIHEYLVPLIWGMLFSSVSAEGGSITASQFVKLFYKVLISENFKDTIRKVFVQLQVSFDANSDGYIDENEYVNSSKAFGVDSGPAITCFAILDTNGDGKLSSDEYAQHGVDFFYSMDPNNPGQCILGPIRGSPICG